MLTFHSNIHSIISKNLAQLQQLRPGGAVYDKALHSAADAQLTACTQRIHSSGQAGDGSDIGSYSIAPVYVNPKNSPASFSPVGKTGKTAFASTGQPHLTRYFDQGYMAYRRQLGLAADKVVLTLRGDLRDGLAVIQTPRGYGLGWHDENLYTLARALEKKYQKKIWAATEQERSEAVKVVRKGMAG
jgi:hypothetical protein